MKKLLFSLAFLAFAAMTIVSCGGKSDPKSVAKSFLEASIKMDYKTAKKFATPETVKMLEMLESFPNMANDSLKNLAKNCKVIIKGEPKIEIDKCTVVATTIVGDQTKVYNITLERKENKWLVNMSKDDIFPLIFGSETPATGAETEPSTAVPAEEAMPIEDSSKAAH
jgi:hypothetical protein